MFNTTDFIYDGMSGDVYNLKLLHIDKSGVQESDLSGGYDIITDSTNLSEQYTFGMIENKPMSFQLSIMCTTEEGLSRYDISSISKWLFNQKQYKKLQILEDELSNVYYDAKLNNAKLVQFGKNVGFVCTVDTNSPYAKEFPTKITKLYTAPLQIKIFNDSDDNGYIKPEIKLYSSKFGGRVSILNQQDSGNECIFTGLIDNEIVTIDSKKEIIKSDKTNNVYNRFNNKFIKLLPNSNTLIVTGDISKIEITYQNLRRVGV